MENKGTYIAVKYNQYSILKLLEISNKFEVPNLLNLEDIHTTLIYSTKGADNVEVYHSINYVGIPKKLEIWKSSDGTPCLVLTLNSDAMVNRHKELMDTYGFTYDYDEYKPHITLSYDVTGWDKLEELNNHIVSNRIYFMLVTTNEYVEDLNIGWKDYKK